MTAYPILTLTQSFVKFQNMDPELQMKDDVLQHIFVYATFVSKDFSGDTDEKI